MATCCGVWIRLCSDVTDVDLFILLAVATVTVPYRYRTINLRVLSCVTLTVLTVADSSPQEGCDDYDQEATFLPSGGACDASELLSSTQVGLDTPASLLIGDNLVQAPKKVRWHPACGPRGWRLGREIRAFKDTC